MYTFYVLTEIYNVYAYTNLPSKIMEIYFLGLFLALLACLYFSLSHLKLKQLDDFKKNSVVLIKVTLSFIRGYGDGSGR